MLPIAKLRQLKFSRSDQLGAKTKYRPIMKTPISYYGGKQTLASRITKLIPPHNLYCEPFLGGAAVFFAKEPSPVEVINDHDNRVINFYRVCRDNFHLLQYLIQRTPHSRSVHTETKLVLQNPDKFGDTYRAWAFWCQTSMTFASGLMSSFAYARKKNSCEKKLKNKRLMFDESIPDRLDLVQIECCDALRVIRSRDSTDSFFYCDPPYFNAVMGHYDGYTAENFEDLLTTLSEIKGKFLLSSYPSDILAKFTKKHRWNTVEIVKALSVTHQVTRSKTEVLTANYPISLPA